MIVKNIFTYRKLIHYIMIFDNIKKETYLYTQTIISSNIQNKENKIK